jgi:hypothetical protein
MFLCCGTTANVESPVANQEKLSVKVPDVSKPLTLISSADSLEQSAEVAVKKEDLTLCVDEVYAEPRKCVVKKSTLVNVTKGAAAVALLATAVYCISNTENAVAILTPARSMYNDFL